MIIYTSICANYGHKARVLANSVREYLPQAKFYLCLTEREIPIGLASESCFDQIVQPKDIWPGNFDRFIFKHSIVEASTAVKGRFLQWLMETNPDEDCFIYLDPDCCVYSDFPELTEALKRHAAVLCPHVLHPGNIDMELSATAHGAYNLGFLAVNSSKEAHRLVDWWADRLYLYCFDDIQRGIFTDQKWMDLAPCFFDVEILRHNGYDLAPWGLLGTAIKETSDGYLIQGQPLRFIHFSGFGPVANQCMDKWLDDNNQDFRSLYADYASRHAAADQDGISHTPWSYASYHSGEPVSNTVRRRYREDWELMFSMEDPFDKSNRWFADTTGIQLPVEERGGTGLSKKMHTAWGILRREGVGGVTRVIGEKLKR